MEKMTLPDWMKEAPTAVCPASSGKERKGFLDRSLRNFASVLKRAFASGKTKDGPMQNLEPRAKLAGFFLLILAAALFESWIFILALLVMTVCLSAMTKAGAAPLLVRALPAIVFTAVMAAPAVFSFVTPGAPLAGVGGLTITAEGVSTALFFVLRVSAIAALAALLVLTTAEADFFRGLGRLLPGFFSAALFFTFKYCLILVKTAEGAALARKSRTIDSRGVKEAQRWFASRAAFILKKSLNTAEEVSMAMVSRGFEGRVATAPAGPLGFAEYLWLGASSFFFFLSFGF
ncbi:Nickel transport protein NikQ [uncultured bacterium]|nr:Nickel transport protein NikQ [uncultured bacterium]